MPKIYETPEIAQVAIQGGEFDIARQWSDKLVNRQVKQDLLNDISAAQANRVRAGTQ